MSHDGFGLNGYVSYGGNGGHRGNKNFKNSTISYENHNARSITQIYYIRVLGMSCLAKTEGKASVDA